ncbi:MAG: glucose-6-phosphate isomerase, partial [Cyclobacteriaceae bacterium]|nr:glucose-6-phosphate isomerase [Cyclobacteriaceae bacterium]
MLSNINPTKLPSWEKLSNHFQEIKHIHLKDLFINNPNRFDEFSLRFNDLLVDFSKNLLTNNTLRLLYQLAEETQVKESIKQMFKGEKINKTEDRSVLHTALRNFSGNPVYSEGKDVMPEVKKELEHMKSFSDSVTSGNWKGYSGKRIKHIVNIGIGGSDLGPVMVTEALKHYKIDGIEAHFISNVD